MLGLIDWIIIIIYFLISLFIGIYFSKKASKGLEAFFLGGRNLPWYVAGVSMVATTFAADTPLFVTEVINKDGIAGNWLWWNMLIGGMLTVFFFSKFWRRANILTDVELVEMRYSGKKAAFLRGFKSVYLGLFMNCMIIGWVNLALIKIFKIYFGITETEALMYVAGAMVVTLLYSSLSGLLGVAVTDFIQFFIAITGAVILAVLVVNSEEIGGIEGLKEKLAVQAPGAMDIIPKIGQPGDMAQTLTLTFAAFLAFTTMQWWASWYPGAEPGGGGYIAQRMMSTKNEQHAIVATLFFQVAHYCLRPWPWILVGLSTIILYPELTTETYNEGYVMAMTDYLPAGLKGLLLVAFVAAYMSTVSTQMNWGASYLIQDFYLRFFTNKKKKRTTAPDTEPARESDNNERGVVWISRLVTVLLMVLSLGMTTVITTIEEVWLFLIKSGAGLGLVLILRWYWWRVNAWSEITATAVPLLIMGAIRLMGILDEYHMFSEGSWLKEFNSWLAVEPNDFFLILGTTTVSWLVVTFLTKPTDEKVLFSFYNKIRPSFGWEPVRKKLAQEDASIPSTSSNQTLILLLICWLSAVVMAYSILFLIGKMIFLEWEQAVWFVISAVLSALILTFASRKVKVFA